MFFIEDTTSTRRDMERVSECLYDSEWEGNRTFRHDSKCMNNKLLSFKYKNDCDIRQYYTTYKEAVN